MYLAGGSGHGPHPFRSIVWAKSACQPRYTTKRILPSEPELLWWCFQVAGQIPFGRSAAQWLIDDMSLRQFSQETQRN